MEDLYAMDAINKFSLKSFTGESSYLLQDSLATSLTINGTVLEGQWQLNNGWYLLCVTENCPYEEAAHFILLDEKFSKLDELVLGTPYTPGIFDNAEYPSRNSIRFSFDSDTRYVLTSHYEGITIAQKLKSKGNRQKNFLRKSFLFMEEAK